MFHTAHDPLALHRAHAMHGGKIEFVESGYETLKDAEGFLKIAGRSDTPLTPLSLAHNPTLQRGLTGTQT